MLLFHFKKNNPRGQEASNFKKSPWTSPRLLPSPTVTSPASELPTACSSSEGAVRGAALLAKHRAGPAAVGLPGADKP